MTTDTRTGRLFEEDDPAPRPLDEATPLAERMRPRALPDIVAQSHLVGEGRWLRGLVDRGELTSLLLWGPPGVGKTTLARLLAGATGARFVELSATAAGVRDVRACAEEASRLREATGRRTVLFVDEIHRFSKTQQDALLPWVESGVLVLVGATTENPSFQVVAPLLSRCRLARLEPLTAQDVVTVLRRALETPAPRGLAPGVTATDEVLRRIAQGADGDARIALNVLELAARLVAGAGPGTGHAADAPGAPGARALTLAGVEEALQQPLPGYGTEEHFDLISALQKSIRSSDPDAAIYWLTRMLLAGEDPLYVARRIVRTASEDVGLADPRGLEVAVAALRAVRAIGMPEGALALVQAAVYLAVAPKSDALEAAWTEATRAVQEHGALPVPAALRNAPTRLMKEQGYGAGYVHAHRVPGGVPAMECLPEHLRGRRFYQPSDRGVEARIRDRLREIAAFRRSAGDPSNEPPGE